MSRNRKRKNRRSNKLEVAIVGIVLCTFFIVFALMININSNKARKQKLATAEQELLRSENELAKALELAKYREKSAQAQLDKAEKIIKEYESSLSDAILVQNKSRLLIEQYDSLNNDLIISLEKTDRLGKQHEEQLAEVNKLRSKTLSMKRNVLDFYHQTREDQRQATNEIAKAKKAYTVSLARLNKANALTKQAREVIDENRFLVNRVEGLERDLSYSHSNNAALVGLVNEANQPINFHHQKEQTQRGCPQRNRNSKTRKSPPQNAPVVPKKTFCKVIPYTKGS